MGFEGLESLGAYVQCSHNSVNMFTAYLMNMFATDRSFST